MKCNQLRLGFELVSPCTFFTRITISPRSPAMNVTVWFGLVPLFNGISTFVDYLMPNSSDYLTHCWEDEGFHAFPMGICLKVNASRV